MFVQLIKRKKGFLTLVFTTQAASCFGPKVFKAKVFPESFVLKSFIELDRTFPCVVWTLILLWQLNSFVYLTLYRDVEFQVPLGHSDLDKYVVQHVYLNYLQQLDK